MNKRCSLLCGLLAFTNLVGASQLSEELDHAIQPPTFSRAPVTTVSAEEVIKVMSPILKDRLVAVHYDRIFPMLEFIEYYKSKHAVDNELTPIEAFKTFDLDMLSPRNQGGPCVTLTLDLLQYIPEEFQAYPCLAALPTGFQQFGFPRYSHSAVLIKFDADEEPSQIAFILLDPSFDFDEPIVIKSDGTPTYYDTKVNGIWAFHLEQDRIICEFDRRGQHQVMTYLTQQTDNIITASAMPMILADRRLSLLSRREDGLHVAHCNIELNKKRVVWDLDRVRKSPIGLSQFQEGVEFPDEFARELHMYSWELNGRILYIIENKAILDELHEGYLELLKQTQDFSITGQLELN